MYMSHVTRSGVTSVVYCCKVDDNVTRHIPSELSKDDWSMMILHYLGLDHIGHLIGPSSSLLPPKLTEMDEIVHTIQSALKQKVRGRVCAVRQNIEVFRC